jgi:uncharacterized membrane protein
MTLQVTQMFLGGVLAVVGMLFHLIPVLTRPDIYFAVTVPSRFRETLEAQQILRSYRALVWAATAAALGMLVAGIVLAWPVLAVVSVYFQVLGCLSAFWVGRHRTKPHAVRPSPVREAQLAPRQEPLPGGLLLQLAPFAILVAVTIYLGLRWDDLPSRFPVHWGLDGTPDGWATRSIGGVFGPLAMGTAVCLGMWLTAIGIRHGSRRIRTNGVWSEQEEKFRWRMPALVLGGEYLLALTFAWVGLLPLTAREDAGPPGFGYFMVGTFAFVGGVVLLLIRTGQGGTRLGPAQPTTTGMLAESAPVGDRTPDECWKAGLLYVNRDDPAVFVENRFGVGYTLNLGHPLAWAILFFLVVVPLVFGLFLSRPH